MGGSLPSPSPPHQYPLAIQLKLYQAFIFSIPILFSIILFLLFYLFYLKRRASSISSTTPILPRTNNDVTTPLDSDLKSNLCRVWFDEYMKSRDSLCCVCLGEFEEKEELLQVVSCKHMFHMDCICDWLRTNSTCPLCRTPIVSDNNNSKFNHDEPPTLPANLMPEYDESDHHRVEVPPPPPPLQLCVRFEGSSSGTSGITY